MCGLLSAFLTDGEISLIADRFSTVWAAVVEVADF